MAESSEIKSRTPLDDVRPGTGSADSTLDVIELATGRLYLDGEPEVRLRSSTGDAEDSYLIVITIMGDGDRPVGLTASVFCAAAMQDRRAIEMAAKDNVSQRVSLSRGEVVSQTARFIPEPSGLAAFLVQEMLSARKELEHAAQQPSR